jgi:MATE family multidrug resistance protein
MVRKLYQKHNLRLDYSSVFDHNAFLRFARLNRDIFIRTLCLIFTLTFFTVQSANNSDTLLTVNTLLFQFFYFFSYFTDGLAYAAEALTGKYFGAGDYRMLKALITRIFRWSLLFVAIFSIVYWVAGSYLITLLTDNPAIIHAAQPFIKWIAIIPIASFMAFIWDGVYVGATASVPMRNSMMFSTVVVFLPAYFLLQPYLHNHALWLAMVLFLFSRGVYLGINYKQQILTPIVLHKR